MKYPRTKTKLDSISKNKYQIISSQPRNKSNMLRGRSNSNQLVGKEVEVNLVLQGKGAHIVFDELI